MKDSDAQIAATHPALARRFNRVQQVRTEKQSDSTAGSNQQALRFKDTNEVSSGYTARQERITAGFEDILRFYKENGRAPRHKHDRDIFERIYASVSASCASYRPRI